MNRQVAHNRHGIFHLLFDAHGPHYWWPVETPFEVCFGAILTQNTNWGNVERAIANLKREGLATPEALERISEGCLAELIRPSGYFNVKSRRLKSFLSHLFDRYTGYEEVRALFMEGLPADVPLYNEYHALIVQHGKERCRPKPLCTGCPLTARCRCIKSEQ